MKKFMVILACSLLAGSVNFAQTAPKLGWIESAELLAAMPEKAKADSDVAKYAREFQNIIDGMIKDYQTSGQQYQANEKTMTDAMKEVKMKELQDLQNRIETEQQSAKEKVQLKNQELLSPVFDKAGKAIKEVAKEHNYDYIIDKSGGILLFAKDGDNIMPLVKAKLGLK